MVKGFLFIDFFFFEYDIGDCGEVESLEGEEFLFYEDDCI